MCTRGGIASVYVSNNVHNVTSKIENGIDESNQGHAKGTPSRLVGRSSSASPMWSSCTTKEWKDGMVTLYPCSIKKQWWFGFTPWSMHQLSSSCECLVPQESGSQGLWYCFQESWAQLPHTIFSHHSQANVWVNTIIEEAEDVWEACHCQRCDIRQRQKLYQKTRKGSQGEL